MLFDLSGTVALVTGAGQGVGVGIARLLAQQGAKVAVNDLHLDRASATAQAINDSAINNSGGTAIAVEFDVTKWDAVEAGIAGVEAALGPIDILVNNAGVPETMGLQQFNTSSPHDWSDCINVNLYGVMHCSRAVINGMRERGFGRVITISSGAGTSGLGLGVSAYGASKGGAISFMRHLALENARAGVTANSVALGLMQGPAEPEATARIEKTIPVRRLGSPEDVGAICVYLASREAAWMTGQTIELNGGSTTT